MTTRFCPSCQAEVQDTGGFCLLGHRLALEAPVASLKALREEVEESFEGSEHLADQLDSDPPWEGLPEPVLASAMAPAAVPFSEVPTAPVRRVAPPPPPPPSPPSVGPPPPPPPPVLPPNPASPAPSGYAGADPIADFAPAPRMDWGPAKGRLKRLRRKRDSE
jgi:hypothetical protein